MAIYKISSPLRVPITKKRDFILGLNNYRNAYYHTLNKSKVTYKSFMTPKVNNLPALVPPVKIAYVLYPDSARLCDVANVCSIHDKYFSDCLVECGKLEDDNYNFITDIKYSIGDIDRVNPRVDIIIVDSKEKGDA